MAVSPWFVKYNVLVPKSTSKVISVFAIEMPGVIQTDLNGV